MALTRLLSISNWGCEKNFAHAPESCQTTHPLRFEKMHCLNWADEKIFVNGSSELSLNSFNLP